MKGLIFKLLILGFPGVLLCSCQPRKYIMKETVIQGQPPPGFNVDHFTYGEATGNVNVLFVVDNTANLDDYFSDPVSNPRKIANRLQSIYHDFLNLFNDPRLPGKISYRVQMITTPKNRLPSDLFAKPADSTLHLEELFFGNPFLIDRTETGTPTPFASTSEGLTNIRRNRTTLFLVYLVGSDPHEDTDEVEFESSFDGLQGFYQTQIWLVANQNPSASPCSGRAEYPVQLVNRISQLPMQSSFNDSNSPQRVDICQPNWGSFINPLFNAIIESKKKYVLSQTPYDPESAMTVKTIDRILRYQQDYDYNKSTHEITILPPAGLASGMNFTVSYYVNPIPNPIYGGGP